MSEELKVIIKAEIAQFKKSLDDAKKSMSGFKEQIKSHAKDANNTIKKMGDGIAKVGKTIGKAILAGAAVAGAAVVGLGKKALDCYGNYEQLVGGIETLFKDSAGTVMAYARDAYKNQQMSANQYMEIATSFSASLLQGLNGDTAEAAKIADMAITDMADNANKMGSSIESIQNAYQGFAKQNYTMLDNLKLGYGGTKEEMQRLLDDAEKLSGIEYDISSYADITEAIHVMQTEMHISGLTAEEAAAAVASGAMTEEEAFEAMGTTAKEASTTIQGSVAMAKAAWTNWVTGLMDDNADINQLTQDLIGSVKQVIENVAPRVGEFFDSLVESIHNALAEYPAAQAIFDTVIEAIKTIKDTVNDVISFVINNWGTIKPILEGVAIAVGIITTAVIAYNVVQAIKMAMEAAEVTTLGALIAAQLASAAATLVALAPYILIVAAIASVIAIIVLCVKHWDEIKAKVVEVANTVWEAIKSAWDWIKNLFSSIGDWIYNNLIAPVINRFKAQYEAIKSIFNSVKDFVGRVWEGIKEKIISPVKTAVNKVKEFIDKIKGFFKFEWSLPKLKMPHIKIQGEFSLIPPKVPKFSIDWYAKGGVFDSPTLFSNGGRLSGLGEAGAEAIVPLENNTEWLDKIADRLASKMGNNGPIYLQVDGRTLGEVAIDNINAITRQNNRFALNLV